MGVWAFLLRSTVSNKADEATPEKRDTRISYDISTTNNSGITPEYLSVVNTEESSERLKTIRAFQELVKSNPEEFIREGAAIISPFFSKTVVDCLILANGGGKQNGKDRKEKIRIVVKKKNGTIDEATSEELWKFFDTVQPKRYGGLQGLHDMLLQDIMFYDKGCAIEGVVSEDPLNKGYKAMHPFPVSSIYMGKEEGQKYSDEYVLLHKRAFKNEQEEAEYVKLNDVHTHFSINCPTTHKPLGRSLTPSLPNTTMVEAIVFRDLVDAIGQAGNATNIFKYDSAELHKNALEKLRYTKTKAEEWVKDQIDELKKVARSFRASDNPVIDKTSDVSRQEVGDFSKLDPALQAVWIKVAAAMNSSQELLGFGDTTRDSFAYQMMAGLVSESRDRALGTIERACEEHLRLQGKIRSVKIMYPRIHLTEELTEENTLNIAIRNVAMLVSLGTMTEQEAVLKLGGNSNQKIDIEVAKEIAKIAPDQNNSKQTGNDPTQNGGGNPGRTTKQR